MMLNKKIFIFCLFQLLVNAVYAQLKNPVAYVDSLKVKLEQELHIDSSKMKKMFQAKDKLKSEIGSKLSVLGLGNIKSDTASRRSKTKLKDFIIDNTIQYAPSFNSNYVNRLTFYGQLEIYGFPINLELVNNYNPLNQLDFSRYNLFKFDFAKQGLSKLYQNNLQKYKDLKMKKFLGMSAQSYLKQGIQNKIQEGLPENLLNSQIVSAYLNNPESIKEMLTLTSSQLDQKLSSLIDKLKADANVRTDEFYNLTKDSLTNLLDSKVKQLNTYIQSIKQELDDNGLDEHKIEFLEKFINNDITERELESFLINELSNQPKLQKAQKIYAKIKEFQVGSFANAIPGSLLNRDIFMKGFNLSVRTLRGPVNVGIAVNKDLGFAKDVGFERSNFSTPKLYTYLSVPTTNFSFGKGKLSWVGLYDRQYQNSSTLLSTAVPKNNMVFTISQNLNLNNFGNVTIDISKSSLQYNNLSNDQELILSDLLNKGNYFRNDILETMSLGLNHSIDSKKMGLKSNLFFNYSGLGFQNPGQQGNANMNMRFGGNIKKNFFNNKVVFYFRTELKNTPISSITNAHWKNYNIQIDSRIKLSRSYTLSLKYIENGVDKIEIEQKLPVYSSKKIQADLNANYKLFGRPNFSHFSLINQQMNNQSLLAVSTTNFIQVNYAQTIVFNGFSLNSNSFYSKQLNTNFILGDMINSDISCQYTLLKSIFLSSGLTYLNNQHLARQVGIRQNIQTKLKRHLEISAYLDIRKDLITPVYPDLFSQARAEFSLKYYLDKQ